jgi:hypothetical protein
MGAGQRHLLEACRVVVETGEAPRSRPSDADGDSLGGCARVPRPGSGVIRSRVVGRSPSGSASPSRPASRFRGRSGHSRGAGRRCSEKRSWPTFGGCCLPRAESSISPRAQASQWSGSHFADGMRHSSPPRSASNPGPKTSAPSRWATVVSARSGRRPERVPSSTTQRRARDVSSRTGRPSRPWPWATGRRPADPLSSRPRQHPVAPTAFFKRFAMRQPGRGRDGWRLAG